MEKLTKTEYNNFFEISLKIYANLEWIIKCKLNDIVEKSSEFNTFKIEQFYISKIMKNEIVLMVIYFLNGKYLYFQNVNYVIPVDFLCRSKLFIKKNCSQIYKENTQFVKSHAIDKSKKGVSDE